MSLALMKSCPKFESCSANLCPLDSDWKLRTHMDVEPVCIYLRELAKVRSGSADIAVFKGVLAEEVQIRIREVYPDIYSGNSIIKRQLDRAGKTPSKLGEFGVAADRKEKVLDSLEAIQPGIRGLL